MRRTASRSCQRGMLGLLAAAYAAGMGLLALGGAYVAQQLNGPRQQALEEIDPAMRQHQPLAPALQDRVRDANRGLGQVIGSGGGGAVVTSARAEDRLSASAAALVASAATGALIERAGSDAAAPTQSVALPPDALALGPCAAATPAYCETRSSCAAVGGHWWADSTCNRQPQPACTANQLAYCFDKASCDAAKGDWLDGECTRDWCWQLAETQRIESPLSRGYSGGATTVGGLLSLDSYPTDPKWSHLITAVSFRWSLDRANPVNGDPMLLCPGDAVSGSASMSNTGNQFSPAGYVPNAYIAMYLNQSPASIPVWRLSSAELPAPGQTVTRPFSVAVPYGTNQGDTLSILAAGYAGRENRYIYVFRLVTHGPFPARAPLGPGTR